MPAKGDRQGLPSGRPREPRAHQRVRILALGEGAQGMHGIHARLAVIGQLPRQSKGSRSRVLLQDLFDAPHDRREELPEPRRRARPPGARD